MPTATVTLPRVHVPLSDEFGSEQFTPAADLSALGEYLIERYPDVLGDLADVEVAYFWKRSGGKKSGAPIFGKANKPSGLITAFTTADAVVWLAADHVLEAEYTARQVEAILFHELQHFTVEEDEETGDRKVGMRGHDVELFYADVRTYGAWDEMLKEAAEAFRQALLFDA
jgi:hypothetical protein